MGIPMRLIRSFFLFLSVILLGAGCGSGRKSGEGAGEAFRIEYARHYRVEHFRDYTLVDVLSPWDSLRLLRRYVLVDRERPLPVGLPEGNIVRTPLQRVVVYSAVHCGMLDELGVGDRIVGVCEPRYIDLDFIRDGVARGAIADLGEASSPDVEKVIDLAPDIIIASPFKNVGYGRIEKTAIPIMECVDYMEVTPLGRAEWMRFMALFFDRGQRADSLFRQTAAAYDSLCRMTDTVGVRPTVLSEKKYGSAWYVPGGRSYIANLYRDAGADYIWADDPSTGSVPLAFETVFEKGQGADFWLIKYNAPQELTYAELQTEYETYRHFDAFKNRNIFVCNTGKTPYYEEMPMHPDRVLGDLIEIFHPGTIPGYRLRYFNRMRQ